MGKYLLERALDPHERHKLGAQNTTHAVARALEDAGRSLLRFVAARPARLHRYLEVSVTHTACIAARTGAKLLRWMGLGPSSMSAARCAGVG